MATTIDKITKLGRKNLWQAVKLYDRDDEVNMAEDMAGNLPDTKQSFEEIAAYGGLSLASRTDEYGNPPQTDYEQIYDATYTATKQGLQFRISREAFNDEQGYGIVSAYGNDMAASFHLRMEMDAADQFMNYADQASSPWAGPDGLAVGSASHTLYDGSTQSNILSPAETIAWSSVSKMIYTLKRNKAHKGFINPIMGPFVLECHVNKEHLAEQLIHNPMQYGTTDHNPNVLNKNRRISRILANPFFDNVNWWSIRVENKKRHGRFRMLREAFQLMGWKYDEDTDSFKATAYARYLFGHVRYHGVMYSFAS